MWWNTQIVYVLALFLILACDLPAFAGAGPPCVKAVSSSNGNFIVVSDFQLGPAGPEYGGAKTVQRVSLLVFPRENFINAKGGVTSTAIFWTDFLRWSVIIEPSGTRPIPGCPFPLITDDGEFLIVLSESAIDFGDPALRIYRRRDHPGEPRPVGEPRPEGPDHGIVVKDISLNEIWPPGHLPRLVSDETPQWFDGGTFEFSPDCRMLIHKTRWGNTVNINLPDGSIAKN
jgi:hypothetical protein